MVVFQSLSVRISEEQQKMKHIRTHILPDREVGQATA
jgi:hypothetical protein